MNVEQTDTDLILTVADGELQRDPTLIERVTNLAFEIPSVSTVRVSISVQELKQHRRLFGTRWSLGKKHLRLNIRSERP